jgi:hypothetical protein
MPQGRSSDPSPPGGFVAGESSGSAADVPSTPPTEFRPQNRPAKTRTFEGQKPISEIRSSTSTTWTKVNPITWKLTDGVQIRVPAARGKWAGSNTDRALAWLVDVSPGEIGGRRFSPIWFARVHDERGDWSFGPTTSTLARQAAEARVHHRPFDFRGAYTTVEPIYLNHIAAFQIDRETAP